MANEENDDGPDRGEPRLLPRSSGQERPRRNAPRAASGRHGCGRARLRKRANTARSKRGKNRRRCADLFKQNRDRIDGVIVTLPNFGEERAIADTLAPGRSARAGADPGHARRSQENDHRVPPRQLLRQDVGLQQSAAVRHSVLDHHAAHREPGLARIRQGPGNGSPASAAW